MTTEDIEKQIISYLQQNLVGGQRVEPDTQLLASGLLDSMTLTHLVAFVEDTFAVSIPDDALASKNFRTPRVVVELVAGLLGRAST